MTKINRGFKRIPANYLFRDVGQGARDLKAKLEAQGKPDDIIKIGVGDPDIPTPQPIVETLQKERGTYRGYPDYDGIPELREAISDYYRQRFNVEMPAENIIIGDGAKSDLSHMAFAFANPGDGVALQDPAYPVYLNWSKFCGLNTHFIQCTKDNNFFGDIPDRALDDNLALIWLCNPNNPTGAVASERYLEYIVDAAKAIGATVAHDIAYTDFRPGELPPYALSIFNIPGGEEVGIESGSFSKPYSMTGDRLGWVAAKTPRFLDPWQKMRSNFDSGVPEYIQHAGVTALTDPRVAEQVKENMIEYGKRAEIIRDGFNSIGCEVFGLKHAPYGWIDVSNLGYSSKEFAQRMRDKAHVISIWGSGFGNCGVGYNRVTVFQDRDKLEDAMQRVNRIDW